MAIINTLQLAARKNLIRMSSDVINYNSNCHSGLSIRHLPTTCLDCFVFPYLKNNVFKNRPGAIPELMQVMKRRALCLEAEGRHFEHLL
jgi:hypothetical protein